VPRRTLITSGSSRLRLQRAEPHAAQNSFENPSSGSYERTRSSPDTMRNDPFAILACGDAAVPVRRWQRVQWQ
jgi:hypothetical protein